MEKLTQEEIDRRMTQWRNDRMLEEQRKKHMQALEEKCERLEEEKRELQATVSMQQATIEKLLLRIEQLETMVFGKKRNDDDDADGQSTHQSRAKEPRKPRTPGSFRRAIPSSDDITRKRHFPIDMCPDCGTPLRRKETVTRYEEDIPLGKKTVEEQMIERGFCPQCQRVKSAIPISPQHCTLGLNIRLYVIFAVTVLGQTFEKIKAQLKGLYCLEVSDGEIEYIIQHAHRRLLPAKQRIGEKIDQAPAAHYDETMYPVQNGEQGDYAWVKTSSTGPETIFLLGRTRGKGNAKELRGAPSAQAGITDDYAGYDGLFDNHGLCWTHPLRKFRDLAESDALTPGHHTQCVHFYERFHSLERAVALTIAAPISSEERAMAVTKFCAEIDVLMAPDLLDFSTLARYKKTFLEHREKYLLCIRRAGVPMSNKKAERSVRHLVIKRLLSFGCRTQKGAQAMETLFSVCLTLWWSKPEDYFAELRGLMAV